MRKSILDRELEILVEQRESWNLDHDHAVLSCDVEESVALILHVYKRLVQMDERNQMCAFRETVSAEDYEQRWLYTMGAFRETQSVVECLLKAVAFCQDRGYTVERIDELQAMGEAIRGILTPDAKFFVGEKQEAMRCEAVDARRQGNVVEMQEMGN